MPKGKLTVCSPTATAISFTASGSRVQRQTDRCIIHDAGACVLFHHHVFRSAVYTCLCQTYELGLSSKDGDSSFTFQIVWIICNLCNAFFQFIKSFNVFFHRTLRQSGRLFPKASDFWLISLVAWRYKDHIKQQRPQER